jgi:VanZ family protein
MVKKNFFSILVALLITYLSLTNSDTFNNVSLYEVPNIDKIAHLGLYFALMSTIILENRKIIGNNTQLFLIALIPLSFGILLEILQSTLTISRSGSIYDVLFNLSGIIVSVLIWLWLKPQINEKIR